MVLVVININRYTEEIAYIIPQLKIYIAGGVKKMRQLMVLNKKDIIPLPRHYSGEMVVTHSVAITGGQ